MKKQFNTPAASGHNFNTETEFYIRHQSYELDATLQAGNDLYLDYPYAEGNVRLTTSDTPTDIAIKLYDARALKPRLELTGMGQDFLTASRSDTEEISVYRLTLDAVRLAKKTGKNIEFMFGDVTLTAAPDTQAEEIEELFPESKRTLSAAESKKPSLYGSFEGSLPSPGSFYVRQQHSRLQ